MTQYNKSLVEAAHNILIGNYILLDEALAAPAHKALASKAANASKDSTGLTAAERISKDVMPIDRINIPLDRTTTPDNRVVNHLSSHGYSIAGDYKDGLAAHISAPNRKVRIGKILSSTNAPTHIKTAFEKDPARQGINNDKTSIVISRKPSDVAAMSTHQQWQSCQTLGGTANKDGAPNTQAPGLYKDHVPKIIGSGAHIAYLVNHPDDVDKHYKPIARTTLNAFKSVHGGHTILRPSQEYGDHWEGFHSSVKNWAEKNFPTKDPRYIRHEGAYPEGEQSINNYSPEHNEYWKSQVYEEHQHINHPDHDVLRHYTDHAINEKSFGMMTNLLKNKHLPDDSADRIVNNVSIMDSKKIPLGDSRKAGVIRQLKKPEHIQKILNNDYSENTAKAVSENQHATSEQLHHVLDMHGAGDNGHGQTMETGYHSASIIKNVARNKNANDSHFHKILNLEELNSTDKGTRTSATINHDEALEGIANNYHSEEIGKKLVKLSPLTHNTVHDVAMKHPHLLHSLEDRDIENGYRRHSKNINLENESLRRGTPELMRSVASYTSDRTLLNALHDHSDHHTAVNARIRLRALDTPQ